MDSWKSRGGKSHRGEEKKWEDQRRKKMQAREKVGKSRFTVFFQGCGSGGSKSRLAKAAGAEPCGQMRDENLHAVVARSTFVSKKAKSTSRPDHFWKLRCRKSARRCGAKHMSKSKCTKHTIQRPLLEVEMSKKCMPLWHEAHSQVKTYKAHHSKTTSGSWDVEKMHAVVARSTFPSQNVQSTPFKDHFWKLRCRKNATLSYTTQHYTTVELHYSILHYTTLHYTTLHYTTPHYTTLDHITPHYATVHYMTLRYITLPSTALHYTAPTTTSTTTTTLLYTTLH